MLHLAFFFLITDLLKELADLNSLTEGCENVASHVGIEASIMFLTPSLIVATELNRSWLVISEHQVIADTFVLLAAIVEVREGCPIEFAGAASQCFRVVCERKVGLPEMSKLNVGVWQRRYELLHEKAYVEHHIVSDNGFISIHKELDNPCKAELFLIGFLNFYPLIHCEIFWFL